MVSKVDTNICLKRFHPFKDGKRSWGYHGYGWFHFQIKKHHWCCVICQCFSFVGVLPLCLCCVFISGFSFVFGRVWCLFWCVWCLSHLVLEYVWGVSVWVGLSLFWSVSFFWVSVWVGCLWFGFFCWFLWVGLGKHSWWLCLGLSLGGGCLFWGESPTSSLVSVNEYQLFALQNLNFLGPAAATFEDKNAIFILCSAADTFDPMLSCCHTRSCISFWLHYGLQSTTASLGGYQPGSCPNKGLESLILEHCNLISICFQGVLNCNMFYMYAL